MVETNSHVSSALSKALEEANAQLLEQREFAGSIDMFQKQLLKDLEASAVEAQSFFQKLTKNMDATARKLLNQILLVAKDAETAVVGLSKVSSL